MAVWVKYFAEFASELSGVVRVSGEGDPIKEVNEIIRSYEIATRSTFIRYWQQGSSFGKSKADILHSRSQKPGRIVWKLDDGSFSNVPFVHCGSCELECHHGPDHFKKIKAKRQEAGKKNENEEHQYSKEKVRRILKQGTKKLDCPAKIKMKHVLLFPDYETDGISEWKRKQRSKELYGHLRLDRNNVKSVHEIHVTLPDPKDGHVGHVVGPDAQIGIRWTSKQQKQEGNHLRDVLSRFWDLSYSIRDQKKIRSVRLKLASVLEEFEDKSPDLPPLPSRPAPANLCFNKSVKAKAVDKVRKKYKKLPTRRYGIQRILFQTDMAKLPP
ncbi:uncharacterized protein LOC135497116 [Lineus longissimus]|uniref:uncharacterized protein LOC135497116 n=1 Tax=Lineus longissimus TaxID=88925 RepID=UPI002B4CCA9F